MSGVRVPASAWALAWICLAGQVVELLLRGPKQADPASVLLSVLLSAAVVWWFSVGVLQARPVRFGLVAILFGAVALFGLVSVVMQVPDPDLSDLADLVLSVAQLVALIVFGRTAYFRARRADPGRPRAEISGLALVALVVGTLGGLTAPSTAADTGFRFEVRL